MDVAVTGFRMMAGRAALQRRAARVAEFVEKHPLISVGTGGCVTGSVGDCLAQFAGNEPFDVRRLLGVTSFSMFDSLCLYLPFYRFLDRRFGAAATVKSVAVKVALDDALFVPCIEVPSFFAWTSIAE